MIKQKYVLNENLCVCLFEIFLLGPQTDQMYVKIRAAHASVDTRRVRFAF